MEAMSPQQDNGGQQPRSSSLTGEPKISGGNENRKKMKSLAQRRQSAPSLVLSKALNKSKTITKDGCFSPVSPESCPLVQAFVCPSRSFIMHSHVQLKTGLQTQERHLFLFTDILIIAKSKSPSHYKLKHHVRVSEMWTASCMEEVCEGSTYPERSFVIGWPVTNCVATFSTPEEKDRWLRLFERYIKEEKENDHPKVIPLKIITKDIGNCAYSKALTVTNEDTVTDVIKMALQQFGVEGSETDYQLWVTSGKDDAPYPLIGHEFPFGIKMSHIRDALPQMQGANNAINLEGAFLMEQLPREMQCQFILKPSRLAVCQQLADPSQKPFKRKRSIINWTFWRGSNSQLDNIPLSPTSSAPGKLFGLSLPAICENDNLPKAVMDMLSVLCQDGPFTRGIFRRSANAKSCKEMKERLNSGFHVDFACESIFVTASVFKDFLRNIPGSVFSSKLCDKWVSVLNQGSQTEKIKAVKKLLEKLPQTNVTLLRYVFGVLRCIEQRSENNQMTAFNLAVCISPSLLWMPNPSSPEAEGEFTRKVSVLVQFLIENYCLVFGDDISLLYANLSPKDDNREDSSDICSFKHIDSSYDSLENELNDDGDSSYSGLPTRRNHDNRSRDSVLTLSDCDLDHVYNEENRAYNSSHAQPLKMSATSQRRSVLHEQSEEDSLCSNTSGYSSTTDVRRHRRCSEPAIGILASRFSQLNESPHENNSSCDALLSQSADDHLKQHRYLQVEGQKLINRSLTLGIDVGKNGNKKQTGEKKGTSNRLMPPNALRLNICSRTSCSSLSSPGTSPSGSSLSSLDSAFSQFSDYSVLNSNEVPSPLDCTLRQHKKQVELSPDFLGENSFSGFVLDEEGKQPYNGSAYITGKDGAEFPNNKISLSAPPMAWLKNSRSAVKIWSSKKTDKHDTSHATKALSANIQEISECSLFREHITVPNLECEAKYLPTGHRPKEYKEEDPQSQTSKHGEEVSSRKLLPHGRDKVVLDKNGNGDNGLDCSSFIFPSPVSINIEISSHVQESTQLPQTFFLGHNISLFSQRNRRKSTNSCSLEEPVLLNSSLKSSSEHSIHQPEENPSCTKDDTTKTSLSRDISIRVASFKKNKVLPSNVDTGIRIANCDLEKNFCVSPKLSTSTGDLFFQSDIHKQMKNPQECDSPITKGGRDWPSKFCSDPKFEDLDQRFFAEESYV
ncbi:rho GTPase-activating protein 20 [Bufo gargarizans]|uniref:rho GTPase-activating protein 20 n=1 Tax=Bufo gargarizans TaxID=30331 RepID=UPI001CF5371F|nr:rho GTPase-activating protein 20 [Bufo gargarizans]